MAGGGTSQGPVKTVALGDGTTLGVNLGSGTLHVDGSGGVGFADLAPMGLSYQYDQGATGTCDQILGACGWTTNYDERVKVSTDAGRYTYQDPSGNLYPVSTDGNGQLNGGPGISVQRSRWTLFDDTRSAGPVVRATTQSTRSQARTR